MRIWRVRGLAGDLPAVAPGPCELVTFGQSFRWAGGQHVAGTVYGMPEPGGALALIVRAVTGRPGRRIPGCRRSPAMRSRRWQRDIPDPRAAPARAPPGRHRGDNGPQARLNRKTVAPPAAGGQAEPGKVRGAGSGTVTPGSGTESPA